MPSKRQAPLITLCLALALVPSALAQPASGELAADLALMAPPSLAVRSPVGAGTGADSAASWAMSSRERFAILPGTDLEKLLDKPTVIGTSYRTYDDAAAKESRLLGQGEVHALLDVPASFIADLSIDYDSQTKVFPRCLASITLWREGNRYFARQTAGFKFLGFVVGYETTFDAIRRDRAGGAIEIEAVLRESLDDKLGSSYAMWYLEPVTLRGKPMTYARFYSSQTIRKPFLGMAGLVNAFAGVELKRMVEETYKEAKRRFDASK